jgi:dTDP-4-dehydrorhamnose reductase
VTAITRTPLFVIGGSGFIGSRAVQSAVARGHTVAYTYSRDPIPIPLNAQALRVSFHEEGVIESALAAVRPDVVLYAIGPHPASDELHDLLNVRGVQRTLTTLRIVSPHALFIFISTNAVFGVGSGRFREDEQPNPETRDDMHRAYGITKAHGERIAREQWPNTLVVRTSMVNGRDAHGALNPRTAGAVASLRSGETLRRFADRYISPTLVDNLVDALLEVASPDFTYRGTLHIVGSERISDYAYARCLAHALHADERQVVPERIADSPSMAHTPRDASLDCAFTQSLLRTRLLSVREQMAALFPDS